MPRAAAFQDVFQAVACPTRRALLESLVLGEKSVSELVSSVDVTQSAVSQQLAVLKNAGLVDERAEGRFRHYRLVAAPLAEIDEWIGRYRLYMEQQLDALGRVLDAMPDEPGDRPTRRHPKKHRK